MKARAAIAAILLCAGCSSSGGGKAHADLTATPKDATIASMLALLPNNAATRGAPTTVNLYWKAARAGHIAVPPAGASGQALGSYLTSLTQQPLGMVGTTLTTQLVQYGRQAQQLSGFDAANIAADIEAPAAPKEYLAARGSFDLKAVDAAVHKDPKWKSVLKTPKYHGTTVYSWAADYVVNMPNANTGLFTTIGGSRRFAFPNSSTFLYARADPEIHDMLNSGNSLADVPGFADLAKALDKKGVYSAELLKAQSIDDYLTSFKNLSPQVHNLLAKHALAPYQQAAIGVAAPNGKQQVVLALSNANHDAAQKNVGRLRDALSAGQDVQADQPWSALFHITSINASGATTIAVLQPTQMTAWQHVYDGGLLLHS
jgi:hypothetical protein